MKDDTKNKIIAIVKEIFTEIGFTEEKTKDLTEEPIEAISDIIDKEISSEVEAKLDEAIEEHEKERDPDVRDVQPESIVEEMNIPLLAQLKSLDYLTLKEIVEKYGDNRHLRSGGVSATTNETEKVVKEETAMVVEKKTKKKRSVKMELDAPAAVTEKVAEAEMLPDLPATEKKEEPKGETPKPKFNLF